MLPGEHGLFYLSKHKKVFTVPFVVRSSPKDEAVEKGIWPGEWHFPFSIEPLGLPSRSIDWGYAKRHWISLEDDSNPQASLHLSGSHSFVAAEIDETDWAQIIATLC